MRREIIASQAVDQLVRTWSTQKKKKKGGGSDTRIESWNTFNCKDNFNGIQSNNWVHLDTQHLKVETLSYFQIHYQA